MRIPALGNAINGSIAGSFSGFVVTPFDVVKTRLMTSDVKEKTPSTIEIFKVIVNDHGVKGLFKGALMRMIYLGIGGFAFFGIYEKIKVSLLHINE